MTSRDVLEKLHCAVSKWERVVPGPRHSPSHLTHSPHKELAASKFTKFAPYSVVTFPLVTCKL